MKHITLALILALGPMAWAADPAKKPAAFDKKITNVVWRWDHPADRNRTLKLRANGEAVSEYWKAVWSVTGEREISLTFPKRTAIVIRFNEGFTEFEGTYSDGKAITGKRQGDVPASIR